MRKFVINSLNTCPPHLYTAATLPCEIEKVNFQQYNNYWYILQIIYFILFTLSQKKTSCYPLTHHTWKMLLHYLVKCTTFSSVCCIPPNVGSCEKSRLWVGIGGSEKNPLWCVANGMSGKQHYSKCSKWPPFARIHASSLFRQWSTASFTMLCWNSAHHVSCIGTRYTLKMKKIKKFVHFTR